VHAPIGLDIGAITPEEIAVAIVAEMIAVRRNVPVAGKSKSVQERLKTGDQLGTSANKP